MEFLASYRKKAGKQKERHRGTATPPTVPRITIKGAIDKAIRANDALSPWR
jgi:hypothetical protein